MTFILKDHEIEHCERKESYKHKSPPVRLTICTLHTFHIKGMSKEGEATEGTSPVEFLAHEIYLVLVPGSSLYGINLSSVCKLL